MQTRTLARATALLVASVVLVAVTWIVATGTATETASAATLNPGAVGGATLKDYFLPKLQWKDVEVTAADPASGATTLQECFLPKLIWRDVAERDENTP